MKRCSPAVCSVSLIMIFILVPVRGRAQGNLPSIKSSGVVSASAFGQFTSIAPGSWIEIYGSTLASTTRSWTGADFSGANAPTSLDGTKVTIGGQSSRPLLITSAPARSMHKCPPMSGLDRSRSL